jgi:hypothetical protein
VSDPWDGFLAGFDEPPPEEQRAAEEDPIFAQLDALHDERIERGDRRWFPSGRDPEGLERLVRERRADRDRERQ